MDNIYKCVKEFNVVRDYYGNRLGKGTIKEGSSWKLIREPNPKKKLYKLEEIPQKQYAPIILYLREHIFKECFKKEDKYGQ